MTKHLIWMLSAVTLVVLSGCDTDRYPISGEECGPDDPVLTLDAGDCPAVPAGL